MYDDGAAVVCITKGEAKCNWGLEFQVTEKRGAL